MSNDIRNEWTSLLSAFNEAASQLMEARAFCQAAVAQAEQGSADDAMGNTLANARSLVTDAISNLQRIDATLGTMKEGEKT